jgi:hypothetical protein
MERSTILELGKSIISMAIFNSYVGLPEGNGKLMMIGDTLMIYRCSPTTSGQRSHDSLT